MSDAPDTSFRRYLRLGGAATQSAARYLGSKILGVDMDHGQQAEAFLKTLGSLKGPVMKVAQFLGTVPDAIPDDYAEAFRNLQSNAPPMGWPFVRRRLVKELGPEWSQFFSSFDQKASAAASLGQVHQAWLVTGEKVACKIQYPEMDKAVQSDIHQLRLAFKLYESTLGALKTTHILQEISERLHEELDYHLERRHMKAFHTFFEQDEDVCIPKAFDAVSTKRLLTMDWLSGDHIFSFKKASKSKRNAMAELLFKTWYRPFYQGGLLHADPHLGNYTVTQEGGLNVMDFGCVRRFQGSFVKGVIDLYHALQKKEEDALVHAYETWGFQNLTKELIEVLTLWATMIYEPLMEDKIQPIQKDQNGLEGRRRAGLVHQKLRELGGVTPPREFVFLDRASVGMGSIFMHLEAEANWHKLFHTMIQDFDAPSLDQTQEKLYL